MKIMTEVVAVFGYNNTRLYDVKKIKSMLAEQKIGIVLCKEGITNEDRKVSEYCFDTKLHGSHQEIEQAYANLQTWLKSQNLCVIGILPFSDKGVVLGSYAAEKMGLMSDDYSTAITGLDKHEFRITEANTNTPVWYKKPVFQKVLLPSDLIEFYNKIGSAVFLKPTSEGNSRGCILVNSVEYIDVALENIKPYIKSGAMVEEYFGGGREFSFDTIAGKCWVTEKETTTGNYRAEVQQIVPAPLSQKEYNRLIEAGKLVAKMSGSKNGAAHNELFLFSDDTVMAIEPNRRPAGMHIWDLAASAFSFNPYELWINWCLGKLTVIDEILQPTHYAGLRMIYANADGIISDINNEAIDKIKANFEELIEVKLSKRISDNVQKDPKDNSEFLGHVIVKHNNPEKLKFLLSDLCKKVAECVRIEPMCNGGNDLVRKIREDASKEKLLILDCAYISTFVEEWWNVAKHNTNDAENKEQLKCLLIEKFVNNEQCKLSLVGVSGHHISGIEMTGLFKTDDPKLAYVVHEALSDLAGINDIKYPYEDHKILFVKPEGVQKKEWGNGAGLISPHCDDLYEDIDTDLLSLTTCRDNLKVPTLLFMAYQIFNILSDDEIYRLTKMMPKYVSGINVRGLKGRFHHVLSYKSNSFSMAFDFRVDEINGLRMKVKDEADLVVLKKIEGHLTPQNAIKVGTAVGNFAIIANNKVLHARDSIQAAKELCPGDLLTTPRLLYRSKGPRL